MANDPAYVNGVVPVMAQQQQQPWRHRRGRAASAEAPGRGAAWPGYLPRCAFRLPIWHSLAILPRADPMIAIALAHGNGRMTTRLLPASSPRAGAVARCHLHCQRGARAHGYLIWIGNKASQRAGALSSGGGGKGHGDVHVSAAPAPFAGASLPHVFARLSELVTQMTPPAESRAIGSQSRSTSPVPGSGKSHA